MNKKAQALFYTLMLGVSILVLAVSLASPTKYFINQTTYEMNCTSSDIDDGTKASCYGYEIVFWFFIALLVGIGFVVIGSKIVGR